MRVAFFGFCALTLLFVGYLLDHQRTVRKLKQHLLAEVDRNIQLRQQAGVDLLKSMPDVNHFWDRLTMEFRRASTMEKNLSLVLIQSRPAAQLPKGGNDTAALSEAAKLISRKLRPSDSLYRLSTDLFALVLPETDSVSAKRITVQLQEELQIVRATHGRSFHLGVHNYPQDVSSAHELEDLVRDLLPEKESWSAPLAAV
jgi:GGDEF domain-containing protein